VIYTGIGFIGCVPGSPFGRSDLESFRGLRQRASLTGPLRAHFFGTSSIVFKDSSTAILVDAFTSRPELRRVVFGRISPDTARVADALRRLGIGAFAAAVATHTHYDHVMDLPEFARRTGAVLLGSPSAANVARGSKLADDQIRVVNNGETVSYGKFRLTFIESRHTRPDLANGRVVRRLVPPAHYSAWRTGTTWSVLIEHEGHTILVHPSSNFVMNEMRGRHADVVYLGIAGLSKQTDSFVWSYWNEVVHASGAKRVILIHWDDFFRNLDQPLRPMPNIVDDFAKSMRRITKLAKADSVEVVLPILWEPTDPFKDLRNAAYGGASYNHETMAAMIEILMSSHNAR
jgi:L-ascorbate metabolism protein UlaG (beta-lactamase superfamily)